MKIGGGFWGRSISERKKFNTKTQLFEKSCTKNFLNNQRRLAILELTSDRVYEYSCPVSAVNVLSIRGDSKNGGSVGDICHSAAPINASDYKQDGPIAGSPVWS
ncbi:MAG: hypothetical protein KGQ79_07760 [Proteobacteria bacterium]|nr:hypothetical protein [Pseudomonadota bacterium]